MPTENAKAAPTGSVGGSHGVQLGGERGENSQTTSVPQVIGYIEKNTRERIRVAIDSYKGHTFCDLRIFANTDDGPRATKSGLTVKPEKIAELRHLLEVAEEEARKAGLL